MPPTHPNWQTLALPTFTLRFQYPDTTPNDHPVEMDEVRLHFRSSGSNEVYFEVTRHLHVSAQESMRAKRTFYASGLRRSP